MELGTMIHQEWIRLKGSKITEIMFLPNKHDLRGDLLIKFNEGKVYRYRDVPEIKVNKMIYNRSSDEYFQTFIRPYYQLEKETTRA